MAVNYDRAIEHPPGLSLAPVAVGAAAKILVEIGVVDAAAQVGVDQSVEAALAVEFDVGAVEFGEVSHLEDLGGAVAGVGAQSVGGAVDEPLGGDADVVHEHLGGDHRDGQFAAEFLVEVHLLLVEGFLQPDEVEFL